MQFVCNNINITIQTIFNIKNPQKFLNRTKKMNSKFLLLFTFLRGGKRKKNRLSVLITITSIMMDSTQINDE